MAKIHIQSNLPKFAGELKLLTDQLSKGTIGAEKFLSKFNKANKDFAKNSTTVKSLAADINKVAVEIEQLEAAYQAGGVSVVDYNNKMLRLQGQMRGLTSEMERQKTAAQKVAEGMTKWGNTLGGVGSAIAKLGTIIGTSLTMDAVAKSAASYGKTLFDLSQNARTTGTSFASLKKASEDINKTTTLSRQESAKLVLSWQQGIKGTKASADEITKLTQAMALNGQSYDEIQSQANELMTIQNAGVDVIKALNSTYQDKTAMDAYVNKLISQNEVTLEAGQTISLLADKMRDGKNAAGDEELVGFQKALVELQKAGSDLALAIGEKLAPMMMQLAGVATEVTKWLATAPDWAVYGAAAVAALGAILIAVAPVVAALGTLALPVIAIGGLITAAAATWAYFTAGTESAKKSVTDMAKHTEDTKKRMAASGNMISGFETEDNEIAAMKAKQRANVVAGAYSKELEDQIDAKQSELTRKMQAAFDQNLKEGKKGPGTGVIQDKGEDKTGDKKIQNAAQLQAALKEEQQRAENIARVTELQVGAEQKRLNFLLNYKNDIQGVEQAADSMIGLYDKQLEQLKKMLGIAEKQMQMGDNGAEQRRIQILGQINDLEAKSIDVGLAKINANKTTIDNKEKELGLLESEMNLQKSIYAGLGPQLDTLSKMNDKLEEAKALYTENAKKAMAQFEKTGMNKYWQEYLDNQSKATAAAQKQVDLTKNLREGYLDAMGAFTNVTGSMAKIITTQQQGLGEMLRTAGQSGSLRGGGLGGGFTNPYAKFKQGGQLETGSRDQLDRLMNARGIGQGIPMVSAASAMSGMSEGQRDVITTGGGKTGITGAGSPGVPTNPSTVSGEGKGRSDVGTNATIAGDPMVMLNQNMSKYVSDGIKMSGVFDMKKANGGGAAGDAGAAGVAGTAGAAAKAEGDKEDAKGKEVAAATEGAGKDAVSKGSQTPEEFLKQSLDDKNKHAEAQKANIAREQAELDAIDKGNRENPVKFQSDVQIGNSGYSRGGRGGGKAARGGGGKKMSAADIASAKAAMRGDINTSGMAEASRINALSRQRGEHLDSVGKLTKGGNASDFASRVAGQESTLFQKYKAMGGKNESGDENSPVQIALRNNAKKQADVMGGLGNYDQKRFGTDAKGNSGDAMTKKIVDNTSKSAKESEKTNKSMDKAREESKQQANEQKASAAAVSASMAGLGGTGALGMAMGSTPTDFGMGAALGLGSGDSFGAGMFGFAEGGTVPGTGTGDTHPALLTPGEIVMPKHLSKKFSPILNAMLQNKYALGGVVGPAPSSAMMGGGGTPNISLNVKGDSVNKIMRSVTTQLSTQLNRMMAPNGTTGRQFELSQ